MFELGLACLLVPFDDTVSLCGAASFLNFLLIIIRLVHNYDVNRILLAVTKVNFLFTCNNLPFPAIQ